MVLQLLVCLRPTSNTGTKMEVATDHHILQTEIGEGKRKSKQIAHCATTSAFAIDFYQGNVTALDSLTPEVINGHIHHSLWLDLWGRPQGIFFPFFPSRLGSKLSAWEGFN